MYCRVRSRSDEPLLTFELFIQMLRLFGSAPLIVRGIRLLPCSRAFTSTSIAREKAEAPVGIPYSELSVGIPKESFDLERRVAATPESVARLVKPGFSVFVEKGAGDLSYFSDADYEKAGAKITDNVWNSDIVLKVSIS